MSSSPAVTRQTTTRQPNSRTQNKNQFSPAPKVVNSDDGVLSLSTMLCEMRLMETRLLTHAEKIVGDLANKLLLIESTLLRKIENEISLFHERAKVIEDRLASVESELNVIDTLNKEINLLKSKFHSTKFVNNQRPDISTDAIIFGIPFEESENLKSVFNQVSHAIDFLPPQIRDIFRIKAKNLNRNTAVIIKFYTPFDRNRVLKAFSDYRRKIKDSINLRTIGFAWDTTFKIYESLDAESRKLLQTAHSYRRDGKLSNVFSSRGRIFVRPARNAEAVHILSDKDLVAYVVP